MQTLWIFALVIEVNRKKELTVSDFCCAFILTMPVDVRIIIICIY